MWPDVEVTLLPFCDGSAVRGGGLSGDGSGYGVTTDALVSAGDGLVDIGDSVTEATREFAGDLEGQSGANEGFVTRKAATSLASK